jgi:hypothetical protein
LHSNAHNFQSRFADARLHFIPSRTGIGIAAVFLHFTVGHGFFFRRCAAVEQVAFLYLAKRSKISRRSATANLGSSARISILLMAAI